MKSSLAGEFLNNRRAMDITTTGNTRIYYNTLAFFILLVIISLQNILAMVFAKYVPAVAQIIFITKEMYIFVIILLVALTILMTGKLRKELIIPFGMIAYLFAVSILASPFFNLVSLRQALVIPVFLLFGFYFAGSTDIQKISRWVFSIYIVIILLGLFERFVLYTEDEAFFQALGVREWANMKGWGYEIPRSWYSGDLRLWLGDRVRRIPGLLIGDAVNFGQSLALPFILTVIYRRYLATFIVFIALVFALSKGGILASLIGIALYIAFERMSKRQRYVFLGFLLLIASGFIYLTMDYMAQIGSIVAHYRGWYMNVLNIGDNLLGGGVGSGGNFARRFGSAETLDAFGLSTKQFSDISFLSYGESYFGTMLAQFGLFGLLFYIYYPIRLLKTRLEKKDKFLQAVKYTALGLFAVGLFAETAFTYIGTGFVVALIPFVLRADNRRVT